jgi:hypothetical protein
MSMFFQSDGDRRHLRPFVLSTRLPRTDGVPAADPQLFGRAAWHAAPADDEPVMKSARMNCHGKANGLLKRRRKRKKAENDSN